MGRKDFQKGMVAGAKPFEEKFRRQGEAIDRVSRKLNERLDAIDEVTDAILDDLSAMEKKRLYDLNTVVNISELDETEKEFLVALLYTIANMGEQITSYQQQFIRSVKNYLGVMNVQAEVDLASIENIESINSQKAILQTIMEYLFLDHANHGYMDEYEDVFEYFSVNRKGVQEIKDKIDNIYRLAGLQGIAENYGYVPPADTAIGENGASHKFHYTGPVNKMGNTLHNLSNGGYMARQGEYLFFAEPENDYFLYRSKINGEDKKCICEEEAKSINVVGNAIYYIVANVIYKVDLDGDSRTKVCSLKDIPIAKEKSLPIHRNKESKLFMMVVGSHLFVIVENVTILGLQGVDVYTIDEQNGKVTKCFTCQGVVNVDENNIYYFNDYKKFYKYSIATESTEQIAQTSGASCSNEDILFIKNKLYYRCYYIEKFLFKDMHYDKIEKNDLSNHIISDIIPKSSDVAQDIIRYDNLDDTYAYCLYTNQIKRFSPDTPSTKKELYLSDEGYICNLHVLGDRLFFFEKANNKTQWKSIKTV